MLVEARVLGWPRAVVEPHEFAYEPSHPVPLRQLIADVLRGHAGQPLDPDWSWRFLQVLAANQVEPLRTANGAPGGGVDVDAVVSAALEGFDHGYYFVFVGGDQVEDLDQLVRIEPTTRVRFVRLVPLAD